MSTVDFSRFKKPKAFGEMLERKLSERSVYRGIRRGSIRAVDVPGMPIMVDVQATFDLWSQAVRPRLQRRQGRRA